MQVSVIDSESVPLSFDTDTGAPSYSVWGAAQLQGESMTGEAIGRALLDGMTRFTGAAWRLERSLAESRASLAAQGAALDRIGQGAVIVDADGRVLFANGPARRMAKAGGVRLGAGQAILSADDPDETERLARLVADTVGGGCGGSVRITRRQPRGIVAAIIYPLPATCPAEQNLALVTLRDLTATTDIAPAQLMDLFGLTAAEAAIVPQLVEGDSAHLIAQSRGVAVATVRAQVARVLAKTGAANLRALASMIAALGG